MIQVRSEEPEVNIEKQVDEDIASFNDFFRELGNDPLAKSERAIIKTYLAWKLGLAKKA